MKIAVVAAMDEEINNLICAMSSFKTTNIFDLAVNEGTINDKQIIAVKSNIGKVNASVAVQTVLLKYNADAVISIGVAGSIQTHDIGSVAVAEKVVQYDLDTTAFSKPIGYIDSLNKNVLDCDAHINKRLNLAAERAGLHHFNAFYSTGDSFLTHSKMKKIHEHIGADVFDMEFGAIAQVCSLAGVPFGCCKAISDNGKGSEEYLFNKNQSALNSIQIIKHFIDMCE